MASDYGAIKKDNIRRRGEDFADIGNFLAEKLYGDRSHFIYELLQNAEDALSLRHQREPNTDFSGEVKFRLFKNGLEVSHYGKIFDEEDVRAICDVLRGTKNERLDQIGTFGIGFKSVYSFTSSPEIHSGNEHFVIEEFIRPRAVPCRELEDPTQTLFYFPFDHPDFSKESAFNLIQAKLRSLGPRSLLFLHHVKELLWIIDGEGRGFYIRETHPSEKGGSLVQILGEGKGQEDTAEDWLLVQRDVQHPTRPEKLPVKVAYSLESSAEGKSVQPLSRSPLTVFFPTAKETGLAFLIHGPFASTPARDNIQSDCPWNDLLVSELAELVADSVGDCKKHGFLNADFLSILPIDDETFPGGSPFRPIYDAVLQCLKTKPLIPTAAGGHARASDLVFGRSQDLRDLLPRALLKELLAQSTSRGWVDAAVTENRLPKVWQYLRDQCGVQVIDGEAFSRLVSSRFFDARDEDWMIRFYSFLTGQEALWRPKGIYSYPPEGSLRKKAIIRCEDGKHRSPFNELGLPVVFLSVESAAGYHIVSRSIYRNEKAAEFMRRLGLVVPDICTKVINKVLPLYAAGCEIEDVDHAKHLETIRDALRLRASPRHGEMLRALREATWVLARNAVSAETCYDKPTDLFVPSPNHQVFFEGNESIWFLAEEDEEIDWQLLGVRNAPVVSCRGLLAGRHSFTTLSSSHGWHKRGFDGFDPNTSIDGLEHALNNITLAKAAYIWNNLLPPLVRFLHGRYETATRQNFENATTHEDDSALCKMLKTHAWIPVGECAFNLPRECTVADMASELARNEGLARIIGIQPDPEVVAQKTLETQETLVTQAGFPPEVAALLVQNKDALTPEIINRIIAARAGDDANSPEFPERPVPNRDRRAGAVRDRTRKADPKTYDHRKRSVRTSSPQFSPKVWLREMYTNQQGVTVCQICCKGMPFQIPTTGEYYFEAVQVADSFAKEDHCLYLALCPLCAARFTILVKKDEDCLSDFIWAIEQAERNDLVIPLKIDGSAATVRFVESHLLDLKTALAECLS